jgi:transcription antitermination factor NusG
MEKQQVLSLPRKQGRASKDWHIGYTCPKAEKRVHKKLEIMGVTSFLPLQKVIKNWSDRKKKLEIPLFPNYIFIHTSPSERYDILQVNGLVRYVTFEGKPATVPDSLINSLQKMLSGDLEVTNEQFIAGMAVKIIDGPFAGIEGQLIRNNGKSRLFVQINVLQRNVSVDISASSIVLL